MPKIDQEIKDKIIKAIIVRLDNQRMNEESRSDVVAEVLDCCDGGSVAKIAMLIGIVPSN